MFDKMMHDKMHIELIPYLRLAWPDLKDDVKIVMVLNDPYYLPSGEALELKNYDFKPDGNKRGVSFAGAYKEIDHQDYVFLLMSQIYGSMRAAFVYLYVPKRDEP